MRTEIRMELAMSQKFCPRCGSPRIRLSTTFAFGISPLKYVCEDCGYNGPIIMEADVPLPAAKNKTPISSSMLKCPNRSYEKAFRL